MSRANKVGLLGSLPLLIAVIHGGSATCAQDETNPDSAGLRERRMVLRLQQARLLFEPVDPAMKPDAAQGVRLLQSILDDRRDNDNEFGAEDVFLDPPEPATGKPADADRDSKAASRVRSLKSEARRLLGSLSAEGRQAYEALVGQSARAQWQAAQSKSDWPAMADIARRWFHTSAGYSATHALALRDLDQSEPLAAARRLEELREWPQARVPREPLLTLQLAVAWRMAGQADRCRDVLMELQRSQEGNPIARRDGGQLVPLFHREDALDWLARWSGRALSPLPITTELSDEWPLVAGNAARRAVAAPAVPTERAAWSQELLVGPPLRVDGNEINARAPDSSPTIARGSWNRARELFRAAREQARQSEQPKIPAAQPIVVGDALIVRTLGQLRAFRISTGEPLWHSAAVDTNLMRLLSEPQRRRAGQSAVPEWESWLWNRTWDDDSSGSLSSDGELVFALHERGMMGINERAMPRMMGVFPQEFNALLAVEARTGRLRWEIGGPRSDLELSNAGTFFLGPPLPWRGQLFVLTDDGVDIRLLVLDPRDGRMLWTQSLAHSEPLWFQVRHDAGLSPSIAGDCVICPTGSGVIVAVDPIRRELRWQCVYREPVDRLPNRRFDLQFSNVTLASAWRQGVAPSVGDRVLVAPPDQNELLCLDARDGRVHWRQPRENGMFLAGIANVGHVSNVPAAARHVVNAPHEASDPAVLIVGQRDVRAVSLADGSASWSQPATIDPVCGRGVLINNVLHLPTNTGAVVSLNAQSGRLLARTSIGNSEFLGNLLAVDGRLLSQSPSHLAAFPALRELQQDFARALQQDRDNVAVLEERGRLNLHLGRRSQGLADLRRAVALRPTADNKQSLAALLLEDLRWNDTDIEATVRELETLVDDPKQRLLFARLRARGLQQQGQHLAAAREFLKLADAWEPSAELEPVAAQVVARADRWTAARLSELYDSLPPSDRQAIDSDLQSRLQAAMEATGQSPLRRFVNLFSWSSQSGSARRALIDRLDGKKHRHELELALAGLRQDRNLDLRAFATARLSEQWLALNQIEMSRPLIDELATTFRDVRCLDQHTGRELAERWRDEFRDRLNTAWTAQPFAVEQVSTRELINKTFHIEWAAPPDASHENWQLELDASSRKLVARDSLGRTQWGTKLPFEEAAGPHVVGNSAMWRGRWLLLMFGERFFVLDTIPPAGADDLSPRLLWQNVLYDRRAEQNVTPVPHQQSSLIEGTPTSFEMTDSSGRRLGRAAIVGDDVIVYQNGQRLLAAELTTGETLWIHDGLPIGGDLSGDGRVVLASTPDRRETHVLSTLDGRSLARREHGAPAPLTSLGKQLLLASEGGRLLLWSARSDACELRLTDALTNQDVFREQFPGGTLPCLSLPNVVALVEPTGRFTIWSLSDGHRLLEQRLPPVAHLTHCVVLRDRERWLLLTNVEEPPTRDKQDKPLPRPRVTLLHFDHWRVHGPCFAFDRASGKQLWTATLDWTGLNANQPADSAVLMLAAKVQRPIGSEFRPSEGTKFQVVALDKRTGKLTSLADDLLAHPMNHCELRPNIEAQSIDVQVERTLHRLSFGNQAAKPDGTK